VVAGAFFDAISTSKLQQQGIYWYLIEQLAVRLKTGQLRNEAIYTFDPTVLHQPGKKTKPASDPVRLRASDGQSGIPPPQEKISRKKCRT
jgi:hypothetical protein